MNRFRLWLDHIRVTVELARAELRHLEALRKERAARS